MLDSIFSKYVAQAPVAVMARGLLENVLAPQRIDAVFNDAADRQYARQLAFSTVVALLADVVVRARPSIHQAYAARREQMLVSVKSVYEKINHCEPAVAAALLSATAREMELIVRALGSMLPEPLPGYRMKIADGNHFSATHRRLGMLRGEGTCLPAQSLAVLDPQLQLMLALVPCEDAHIQERALVPDLLPWVEPRDLWIVDRNFCTTKMLFGIRRRQAFFLVRQHQQCLRWKEVGEFVSAGPDSAVAEQPIEVWDADGSVMRLRRIRVRLDQPTRDGQRELCFLTNLPPEVAAATIAELYRCRWRIETAFQEATVDLCCEISALGTPGAAILVFAVAMVCFNAISVLKAALRTQPVSPANPAPAPEARLDRFSTCLMADQIASIWPGMEIVLPETFWTQRFGSITTLQMASELRTIAEQADVAAFQKRPPRKSPIRSPTPPRPGKHTATARKLELVKKHQT